MKPFKSLGPDAFNPTILKESAEQLTLTVVYFYV